MKEQIVSPGGVRINVYSGTRAHMDLLLFHGGGFHSGSPDDLDRLSELLAEKGIRVFAPSYRTKRSANATPRDAIDDAIEATSWLKARDDRSPRRAVGGLSAGGFLALHALRNSPDAFERLVLMNPVTDTGPGGFANLQVSEEAGEEISVLKFAHQLPRIPTLIVHPILDEVVPLDHSIRFLSAWENPKARLAPWPATGHGGFRNRKHERQFISMLANTLR